MLVHSFDAGFLGLELYHMPEQPYSNRELDAHFKNLMEHMTSFEAETGASLMRIEEQTRKTNGRVSELEESEVSNKIFRARITTAISILTFIVGTILVPLIGFVISAGKF